MNLFEVTDKHTDQDEQKQSNRHECLICFRVFASRYRLRRHSIVHSTDNRIFNCQFCESSFRLHNELIIHESTHKRTLANINLKRCKICGIACDSVNLLAHFKENHEHFECDLCKKVYRTKSHLKVHMKIHINAREYKCSVCPKTFNFFSQVKRHERSHSTQKVWYCEICGVGYKNKPSLSHHVRSHNGEKPFRCDRDSCDRCFSTKQSLRLHIRIHDGIKPYKCPWQCGRGFHDLATMKVHTRQHTNENPYTCHLCGKTTKQASNLKSHYLHAHKIKDITSKTIRANARLFEKHKTENLPEAGLLEILSQQVMENLTNQYAANAPAIKQEVTSDKHQLDPERQNIQEGSTTEPTSSDNVRNPVANQNEIKVEASCEVEFNPSDTRSNELWIKEEALDTFATVAEAVIQTETVKLKKEGQTSRDNSQTTQQQPIKEKRIVEDALVKRNARVHVFQIRTVENGATRSQNYRPMKSKSVDRKTTFASSPVKLKVQGVPDAQTDKSNNQYQCDICPSSFRHKVKLTVHMKSHTVATAKTTDKSLKICEICGKTYTQNSALQKHLKFHSNIRPFSCEICGRTFKDSNGLKVHIRSHSGEKPYSCSFCPKSFSTSMGRNLHQRGHTGEKPYKCTYCDSAFSDNSTCTQHIRIHTGEKPYVCHICGKGTTQAGNLKSHLRHAHKIHVKNVTMKREK